jgi:predicted NACHT family NTPase
MELFDLKALLKSPIESFLKEFGAEIRQLTSNKILEYEVEEYNRNLYSKTILHRASPKKLDEFYQPLSLLPLIKKQDEKVSKINTQSSKILFKDNQFITVIGSAGSGKSTLVKYLFVNSIDENFRIPIKIELRYLNDYSKSLFEYLYENIYKLSEISKSERIIERLLASGNFLIFLDGYDELNLKRKEKVTKDIDNLTKKFNKNSFLLTSRPYTEVELLPLFHNYEVCDLEQSEIESFISKQIPSSEIEISKKIIESIHKPENLSYVSFLSNPLLLSMFILTFQSYADIPQKKTTFYRQVFETLFTVHDSMSKLAFVREKQSGLTKEQFEEVLKLFSFISFFEDKFTYDSEYLNIKLNFIKENKKTLQFSNDELINDLQVAVGIINKDGLDYTFPHRSLQEYFAALYIANLSRDNKEKMLKRVLADSTKDKNNFLIKENFYSILVELDPSSILKQVTLPILKKIQENLLELENMGTTEAYDLYGDILLTIDGLMPNEKREKYFKNTEFIAPILIGKCDADFLNRHKVDINKLDKFLKNFKTNFDRIEQDILNELIEEEKSDEAIIDMI